jgi:hypothetical protein
MESSGRRSEPNARKGWVGSPAVLLDVFYCTEIYSPSSDTSAIVP